MRVEVVKTEAGFYANLGGTTDLGGTTNFGPVPTQEQARALGVLYSCLLSTAVNAAELNQYPTPEDTLDIFHQMMEKLSSV